MRTLIVWMTFQIGFTISLLSYAIVNQKISMAFGWAMMFVAAGFIHIARIALAKYTARN